MLSIQVLRRGCRPSSLRGCCPYNRCHISSAAQSYLDGWVGLPHPSQTSKNAALTYNPVAQARAAMVQGPLLLSGTSYLLPTLRLEQRETPESLKSRLELASGNRAFDSELRCPIVLDTSALAPDGSPHYRPPEPGSLLRMISILGQFGMQVMGITAGNRELSAVLAEEASTVGIPSVWSPRKAGSDPKFDVAQIIQYVQRKQEEQQQNNVAANVDEIVEYPSGEVAFNGQDSVEMESYQNASKSTIVDENNEEEDGNKPIHIEEAEPTLDDEPLPTPFEFSSASTVYHGSVRSGQQIMSKKGQSLVILGSVNSGGEVLSDGDIFIFGRLRGRAFAGLGATPNPDGENSCDLESTTARIVATSFDAELVAIGDVFTTIDKVEDLSSKFSLKPGGPVMVTVDEGAMGETARCLKFMPVNL
jgi:septum site-determining protein MinC